MIITNNHENNDNSAIFSIAFLIVFIKVAIENVKIKQILFDRHCSHRDVALSSKFYCDNVIIRVKMCMA